MIRRSLVFAVFFLLFQAPAAQALEGIGFGETEAQARQRAAADLAAAIKVQVKSVVESCTQVRLQKAEDCGSRVLNLTATELPLLGLEYQALPGGNEAAGARAILRQEKAAPLYRDALAGLSREFAAGAQALAASRDNMARHGLLSRQLAHLRALEDHRLVAIALGMSVAAAPASETTLTSQLAALEDIADAIPFAARVLLKDLHGRLPEARPITPKHSQEATPLSIALADALRIEMAGRSGPRLRATGEYSLLDNGEVSILLDLRDDLTGRLLGTRGVRLTKAGYAGYCAEPLAPDFEKLLQQGEALSSDLRVELVTHLGSRQLKFKAGDTLKLVARMTHPGYFYVVGHIVRPDAQWSYLLPLQEDDGPAAGAAQFIRRVSATQTHHYLEIGEFIVEAPFGTEHLHIIASTRPVTEHLPVTRYDAASGYHIIQGSAGNAAQGVMVTRGLKPKPNAKAMVAENTLSMTTTER